MTFIKAGSYAGCIFLVGIGMCRADDLPQSVKERLQNQVPAEKRTITVVPDTLPEVSITAIGQDPEQSKSFQDLLDQVETRKGGQPGTVKILQNKNGELNLQFDLSKIQKSFPNLKQVPFGLNATESVSESGAPSVTAPVTPEYRTEDGRGSVQKIVAIKSKDIVAANAFASGVKPVSLRIEKANLVAAQIPSLQAHLAVNVRVGDESHEMNVAEVRRFGNMDVTILASSNATNSPGREGLPYSLRVQVMPAQ
jgi:hypothetical protein